MTSQLMPSPGTPPPNTRWDGRRWVTLDGRWWWDGLQWQASTPADALSPFPTGWGGPTPWYPPAYPYVDPRRRSRGGLYALSIGLFLLAFPCLIFPPLGVLVWALSVITLIIAIAQ